MSCTERLSCFGSTASCLICPEEHLSNYEIEVKSCKKTQTKGTQLSEPFVWFYHSVSIGSGSGSFLSNPFLQMAGNSNYRCLMRPHTVFQGFYHVRVFFGHIESLRRVMLHVVQHEGIYNSRFHPARPPENRGHPNTSFVARTLAPKQRSGTATVFVVHQPGAIVRGKNDVRVFVQTLFAKGVQDLPNAPVNLLNNIAIQAALTFAFKLVGNKQGDVRQ